MKTGWNATPQGHFLRKIRMADLEMGIAHKKVLCEKQNDALEVEELLDDAFDDRQTTQNLHEKAHATAAFMDKTLFQIIEQKLRTKISELRYNAPLLTPAEKVREKRIYSIEAGIERKEVVFPQKRTDFMLRLEESEGDINDPINADLKEEFENLRAIKQKMNLQKKNLIERKGSNKWLA